VETLAVRFNGTLKKQHPLEVQIWAEWFMVRAAVKYKHCACPVIIASQPQKNAFDCV
jgi:hypothetical protein